MFTKGVTLGRSPYRVGSKPPARRAWWMSAVGAAGAVALHVIVFSAIALGSTGNLDPRRPQSRLEGTPDSGAHGARDQVVVLIGPIALSSDTGIADSATAWKPISARSLVAPGPVRQFSAEVDMPEFHGAEEQPSSTGTSSGAIDGAERTMLYRRYVNQISARIERAWIHPTVAPGGSNIWSATANESKGQPFRCRVEISQAEDGDVLEVTLLTCDSSPAWQQSLVNAIDAASPLPAPSNQAVFSGHLVISFASSTSSAPSAMRPAPDEISRQKREE